MGFVCTAVLFLGAALALAPGTAVAAGISASSNPVAPGGSLTVSWNGVSQATTTDWIGLYDTTHYRGGAVAWEYDDTCKQTSGSPAKTSGSCPLTVPSTTSPFDSYELRLYAHNGYTLLGSTDLTVRNGNIATVLTVANGVISWPAQPGVTDYKGASSTAPRGQSGRTTTYQDLGNVTSWTPATPGCGTTLYYGVASEGSAGELWSSSEVSVSGPSCGQVSGVGLSMGVGINGGNWGGSRASDQVSFGGWVRASEGDNVSATQFWQAGGKVIMLVTGCNSACADGSGTGYSLHGVTEITPSVWASNAVALYQSDCAGSTVHCPAVEVLNEPYGNWFWGSNAGSQTDASAYATLIEDTYTAFHNRYGTNAPKILGAFDDQQPWDGWFNSLTALYVDGITVHPYGYCGDPNNGAQGRKPMVTDAGATGKSVWVTEVGWETNPPAGACTGGAMDWTYHEQAANIYNFIAWARSLGYVEAVTIFGYVDYGGPSDGNYWGVLDSNLNSKPGYTALQEAAKNEPCTVCG